MEAIYRQNIESGRVELVLIPWESRRKLCHGRVELPSDDLSTRHLPAKWHPVPANIDLDSLLQIRVRGDRPAGGYSTGQTMRDSPDLAKFRFSKQSIREGADQTIIETYFERQPGIVCMQRLRWSRKDHGVRVTTQLRNCGTASVTIDMMASFSLGGLTPFAADDAPNRLRLHRYLSNWSNEGRPQTQTFESLGLERSWMGVGARTLRFGQIGSLPVNGWFPQMAVEDTGAGVTWAAQIAWPGSWQIEVFRLGDTVAISGGLADRDFGHWWKCLEPGDEFVTPESRLTVVCGDADAAAMRLVGMQESALFSLPRIENRLPIVFNEWCTSWGAPTHDNVLALADTLQGIGVTYVVIDANWSVRGDWITDKSRFPHGLKVTCAEIRKRGFIPGIWFEFEVATKMAHAFSRTEHALSRDGVPLEVSERHFWDFRDLWTHRYLSKRVIGLLRECGFGYLKVDYNASVGGGVDGAESPGEGLRQHLDGVRRFFRKIRAELPNLVIENCSSGGHRLEPSMQELCAVGVFSDAHECVEIPILAANLHRHILPRQSQVWAVLRRDDDARRVVYSLAATFLGRVALSGDITALRPEQAEMLRRALRLYRMAVPVIRAGRSTILQSLGESYRYPKGWQVVQRISRDGKTLLVVAHRFGDSKTETISAPLHGDWKIVGQFAESGTSLLLVKGKVLVEGLAAFAGCVFLLKKVGRKIAP